MQERATEIETLLLFFELEWAALEDDRAEELLAGERLDFCRHHLRSVRRYRPHLLSESEEKILAEKSISSQAAWSRLFGELVAALRVPLDGQELTLDVALSRLQQSDREVRRDGRRGGLGDARAGRCAPAGFIYNTLAYDKSVEDRLRHYPHWLASRNLSNEASDESVMALIEAVRGALRHPAALVPAEGQAARDRSAGRLRPLGPGAARGRHRTRSPRRASSCSTPTSRSPRWPARSRGASSTSAGSTRRPGRTSAAARSAPTPCPSVHPYVLLNFTAQRRDVLTMAHELGHGLHAALAQPQGVFHQSTPLTLAETASVFGEELVFGRMLADAADDEQRLGLLAERIDGAIATVFRQIAMNRFEHLCPHPPARPRASCRPTGSASRGSRPRASCSATRWRSPTATACGGPTCPTSSTRPATCTPTPTGCCWRCRSTAATSRRASRSCRSYLELLSAGGSRSPEQLAEIVGIDLTDPGFWDAGLALVEKQLTEAEALAA